MSKSKTKIKKLVLTAMKRTRVFAIKSAKVAIVALGPCVGSNVTMATRTRAHFVNDGPKLKIRDVVALIFLVINHAAAIATMVIQTRAVHAIEDRAQK